MLFDNAADANASFVNLLNLFGEKELVIHITYSDEELYTLTLICEQSMDILNVSGIPFKHAEAKDEMEYLAVRFRAGGSSHKTKDYITLCMASKDEWNNLVIPYLNRSTKVIELGYIRHLSIKQV